MLSNISELTLCRSSKPLVGMASLQRLCERELARSLVEPRTVLQVLDFADAAGSNMLRAHCLGVSILLIPAFLFSNVSHWVLFLNTS